MTNLIDFTKIKREKQREEIEELLDQLKKKSEAQTSKMIIEQEADFEAIMKANAEKKKKLEKERSQHNQSVKRSHNLRKKK